jgi:hypothetical protein
MSWFRTISEPVFTCRLGADIDMDVVVGIGEWIELHELETAYIVEVVPIQIRSLLSMRDCDKCVNITNTRRS